MELCPVGLSLKKKTKKYIVAVYKNKPVEGTDFSYRDIN